MSLDACPLDPLGSQAMGEPYIAHVVLQEDDEDLLKILGVFGSHNLLNLGGFDVIFVVDLEFLEPGDEILDFTFDLVFSNDGLNHNIIGVDFQYVLKEDSQ